MGRLEIFDAKNKELFPVPIGSMYGTFAYIYHKHQPNVGEYTQSHGSYGVSCLNLHIEGLGYGHLEARGTRAQEDSFLWKQ